MKTNPHRFDALMAFKVFQRDREALLRVAEKLELDPAEIARRAFRAGLVILDKTEIPGNSSGLKVESR